MEKKPNRQDVLEALAIHADPHGVCEECPYQNKDRCSAQLAADALELMEEVMRE